MKPKIFSIREDRNAKPLSNIFISFLCIIHRLDCFRNEFFHFMAFMLFNLKYRFD